ncbi:Uncharacterised protein g10292 [Pycnogonum litorale]
MFNFGNFLWFSLVLLTLPYVVTSNCSLERRLVVAFYTTFETNLTQIGNSFTDSAVLNFDGSGYSGKAAIIQKLTGLPFTATRHTILTIDCQAIPDLQGRAVLVVGQVTIDKKPYKFSELFIFKHDSTSNRYLIQNQIIRLHLYHE